MSELLERRRILQGLGAAALGAGVLSASTARAQAEHQVPWSAGTEAPKLKAPQNACDCHMHIYDSRFPIAPSATLKPADAKADDYRLLQKRIGTTRNVVVQPSTYGTDNSCTLDGMAKLGPTLGFRVKDGRGRYRSNVVWLNPEYEGPVSAGTVVRLVKESNG